VSARHPHGVDTLWQATQLWSRGPSAAPAANEAAVPSASAAPFVERRAALPEHQRRIGKYLVQEVLGQGAMGIVYKALDPHIQRTVALKTIQRRDSRCAAAGVPTALRFRNEAQAAGRLSHPGIVSVYDYGEFTEGSDGGDSAEQSYIAMEYVQGPTLAECARRPRLPLADVLCIASQLLDALQCAHDQGVWHRDIKPGNLILTAAGQLKVADFGIARIDSAALTQDAWSMGSPGYMAPECYTGMAIDHRVDLYACGVLLFELLTGTRPFRGSPGVVMYQALHDTAPSLAQARPGEAALAPFEALVARGLARDREHRFASANEMREALRVVAAAAGFVLADRVSANTVQSLLAPAAADATAHTQTIPTASRTPSATLPRTAPPDAAHVAALTRLLQPHLGPMANLVVQRAPARAQGLAAWVAQLAHELPQADDRRAFLAQAQGLCGAQALPPETPTPALSAAPADLAAPISEAWLQRLEQALVQQIGPIGKLLLQRALKTHRTREALLPALADAAADLVDRDQLLGRLTRVGK
jgi:eukaryotic-like serine/threonine-protein kinase